MHLFFPEFSETAETPIICHQCFDWIPKGEPVDEKNEKKILGWYLERK